MNQTTALDANRLAIARIFRRFARRGTAILAECKRATADRDEFGDQTRTAAGDAPTDEPEAQSHYTVLPPGAQTTAGR